MQYPAPLSCVAPVGASVSPSDVIRLVGESCPQEDYRGKRVVLIIPDSTRTCPVGQLFQVLHAHLGEVVRELDVMIALGTHQPMSEEAICQRLEI